VSIAALLPQPALPLQFNSSPTTEERDVADDDMETAEEKSLIDVDVLNVSRGRLALSNRCTLRPVLNVSRGRLAFSKRCSLRVSHFLGLILTRVSRIC
jgi:hypothetical protein